MKNALDSAPDPFRLLEFLFERLFCFPNHRESSHRVPEGRGQKPFGDDSSNVRRAAAQALVAFAKHAKEICR